eukprot:985079_1
MHSYFLHSTLKFGAGHYFDEDNKTHFDERRDDINTAAKGRSYSSKCKQNNTLKLSPITKPLKAQRTMPAPITIHLIERGVLNARKYKNMYGDCDDDTSKLPPLKELEAKPMVYAKTEYKDIDDDYVGTCEDKAWLRSIAGIKSECEIYNKLVQFCGIFRWQNAHGFRSRHFHGLQHINAE